jgi:hypothetical protein
MSPAIELSERQGQLLGVRVVQGQVAGHPGHGR